MTTATVNLSIPKPPFRAACNGCGLCCRAQICELGEQYFPGAQAPCPALRLQDGKFQCGLALTPSALLGLRFNGDEILAPLFAKAIGSGQGCGMEDET